MTKKILCFIMALIIALGTTLAVSASTLSELQSEQDRLEQEAKEYDQLLADKKDEIEEQEEYVATIADKVANINSQIAIVREKIASQEATRDELTAKAEGQIDLLRERIRALYMSGDTTALEIVLGAKDFGDFVDKVQIVGYIADSDEKLINDINTQLDEIDEVVAGLEDDKSDLDAKQTELNTLLEENEEALAKLHGEKDELEDKIHANENSQSELDKKLQEYYDSQKKPSSGGGSSNTDYDTPTYSGNYVWPVPGFYWLSSQYYEERTGYYHGGIDIAGSGYMGATVVAAASGTVIYAENGCSHNYGKYGSCGCGGGYGNYVWIDHGGGKATIYAHLSYHTVYVGQRVSAGQVIGYGGSTGYSTGPHLHFECRYYGNRYDPMTELS